MKEQHILSKYDKSLQKTMDNVVSLGRDIVRLIGYIDNLIKQKDMKWANRILGELEDLNSKRIVAMTMSHEILLQYQPVASDLRFVISLSKICEKLKESIRLLGTMARRGKSLGAQTDSDFTELIQLLNMAYTEMNGAVLALEFRDKKQAKKIKKDDKVLDRFHKDLIKQIITSRENHGLGTEDLDVIFFIRAVERMGDTAKGVARDVISMYPESRVLR